MRDPSRFLAAPTGKFGAAARRSGSLATAIVLLLSLALAACDNRVAADGSSDGNSSRGHVRVGLPF